MKTVSGLRFAVGLRQVYVFVKLAILTFKRGLVGFFEQSHYPQKRWKVRLASNAALID